MQPAKPSSLFGTDLTALSAQLAELMYHDRWRLQKQLQRCRQADQQGKFTVEQLQQLQQQLARAQQKVAQRQAQWPTISYPELPVTAQVEAISQQLQQHQVLIIAGETGSGKTTQLPKICLQIGLGLKGMIGHTQPRRLAARSVAKRIAEEMATPLGGQVGYKVRFAEQVQESTLIKVMTDGILLAEIQRDPELWQYEVIIIDEAHERSLNIDFILGYLQRLLVKRADLKVIITSATIDPQRFARHFNQAPILTIEGRSYPVDIRYRPLTDAVATESTNDEQTDQISAILQAVAELSAEGNGDILIFLSGEREIRDTAQALIQQQLPHTEVIPLYARLTHSEQNRIFQPHSGRRIVLATNVAETSLTVPGIRYVIDPGKARISRYSHRAKVQRLPIEPISQASANQRAGRCGRLADGICIRLYSEQDYLSRPAFTDAEILRTNLASVILQMTALNLGDIQQFPFIDMPAPRHIQAGIALLLELSAIASAQQPLKLTPLGRQLANIPLDPRLARMLIAANQQGALEEVLVITAALTIQDPRERPSDKQQAADECHRRFVDKRSDFMALLNLWHYLQQQQQQLSQQQFRRLCQKEYLHFLRIREWQDLYSQLKQIAREMKFTFNQLAADYRSLHCALLTGLLTHIGQKELKDSRYLAARQQHFFLFPNSSLFKKPPKWVMVAELVETSRLWGRTAAQIEAEWIEPLALDQVKRSYSEPHWSKSQGAVMATERVTLYGVAIVVARSVNYGAIDPPLARELFIRHALLAGEWSANYPFIEHNQQLVAELQQLEDKARRRDLLVDEEQLYQFYHQRLPADIVSTRHFAKWWQQQSTQQADYLHFSKALLLNETEFQLDQTSYPSHWQQGSWQFALTYQFAPGQDEDGVTISIPLALLNQIEDQGFDWQIPALRHELVVAWIKSLPKSLRRQVVPAPDYAHAFLQRVAPYQQPLLVALQQELKKMTGVNIEAADWQITALPTHLLMTFQIIDEHSQVVAQGKSLTQLKQQLQTTLQGYFSQTLSAKPSATFPLEGQQLRQWDFADLPREYQQQHDHYTVKAYPALVDEGDSVSLALFDNPHQQQRMMWAGIRRLLLLALPSPVKYLQEKLSNKAKLALYYTPYGNVAQLINDCVVCALDSIMREQGAPVWQQADYQALLQQAGQLLQSRVVLIANQLEPLLILAQNIHKRLKGKLDLALSLAFADIKQQLGQLIYPGFVSQMGDDRLADGLRYLQAIELRLEKLMRDPQRDRVMLLKVQQVQQQWQTWLAQLAEEDRYTAQVIEVRWMIEELRVSLFAQTLGTRYAISEKRIMQAMDHYLAMR